jgi:hypothetical protein
MSDLSRLEGEAWDRGYACGKQEAADRIEQLEAALRPFITHYADWMDRYPDTNETSTFPRHTYGDIRRARAALAPEQEK